MASVRDIKNRIKGVKNIQQITRTMEMVAAAKLRRAQNAAQNARPYAEKINALIHNIGSAIGHVQHPLLKRRPVKKVALVVVTSNKGLCGGFNANILRKVEGYLKKRPDDREYSFFCIGKKGKDYFSRREHRIKKFYLPSDKEIGLSLVTDLVKDLAKGFEEGEFDEVVLFFSKFISTMVQSPTDLTIIPFAEPSVQEEESEEGEKKKMVLRNYIFEPEPEELMGALIPKYLESQVYNALAQSQAGEQAARLVAMKSASDNANDMIKTLTLSFNKARQAGITNEILEIVSGSEAIKAG